jgi:hypothetical protein
MFHVKPLDFEIRGFEGCFTWNILPGRLCPTYNVSRETFWCHSGPLVMLVAGNAGGIGDLDRLPPRVGKSRCSGGNVSRETSVLDGSFKTVLNGMVFDEVSGCS